MLSNGEGPVGTYSIEPWSPGGDDSLVFRGSNNGPFPSVDGNTVPGSTSIAPVVLARHLG